MEPRTITLAVTFPRRQPASLGPPGSERGWVAADRRGRHYKRCRSFPVRVALLVGEGSR